MGRVRRQQAAAGHTAPQPSSKTRVKAVRPAQETSTRKGSKTDASRFEETLRAQDQPLNGRAIAKTLSRQPKSRRRLPPPLPLQ